MHLPQLYCRNLEERVWSGKTIRRIEHIAGHFVLGEKYRFDKLFLNLCFFSEIEKVINEA